MSSKPPTHLQPPLDPGILSKRRSRSFCSLCLIWSSLIFGTFIVFSVIVPLLDKAILQLRDPHFKLLANVSTSDDRVIRPLVDQDQTFDIAVTVWLRAEEEEEKVWKESLTLENSNSDSDASVVERQRRLKEETIEVPLYSDIAFRGLRLSDRHITADVKFRLPTRKFLDQNLTATDLRGSFVLIPSSPSPLDYLVNFSTSYPKSIAQPPVRSWPFPLGSDTGLARALADKAIDSFGCSTSLLEFHEIYPRCAMSGSSALLEVEMPKVEENEDDDDDDEKEPERLLKTHNDDKLLSIPARKIKISDSDPDHPLYAYTVPHPHIVTRSQIRIVEETRQFDLKAYNKAHKELQGKYCRGAGSASPSRKLCRKSYQSNGHWDTRMKLELPRDDDDESSKTPRIEWVYSPFMSARHGSAGPLDIIPVPVSRENCTFAGNDTTQTVVLPKQYEEYMDITWRISFSGRTPGKLILGDALGKVTIKPGFNQTKYETQNSHSWSELINGIAGHRFYADAHPRRRAVIEYIPSALSFTTSMLDIHYWYTRTSTRFISIAGTMHISTSELALTLIATYSDLNAHERTWIGWVSMIPTFLLILVMISPYINMIKVVLRLKWQWKRSNWRTQAPMRRVPATHQERASERLDRRTNHIMMTGLLLALLAYFWVYPDGQVIIPPNMPSSSEDTSLSQWSKTSEALRKAMISVGTIYQILLNHRGHTFAGRHRSATIINFICEIINLSVFVPGVVGRYDLRPGLFMTGILSVALSFTLAWQAIWMRGVPHQGGEMDDDED